jgi:hypothetical protein
MAKKKSQKDTAPKPARRVGPAATRTPAVPTQGAVLPPQIAQQITRLVDQRIGQVLLTVAQKAAQQRAVAATGPRPGGMPQGGIPGARPGMSPQAGLVQGAPMPGARPGMPMGGQNGMPVDPRALLAARLRGGR